MHITHIVSTYPPYRGGMGNVAFELVHRLEKKGHKIRVLTPLYQQDQKLSPSTTVMRLDPWFAYGNSAFVPNLYSQLSKTDIIHLHYPFFGGAESVAFFKQLHPTKPLVISYHMDVEGAGLLKAFFQIYRKTLYPWIMKQADLILVSSMDYANHSSFLKLNKHRSVKELPFGVDEQFHAPSEQMNFGELNLLFVGGLDKAHYFKGLDFLIDACSLLEKKEISYKLRIVGDGDLRAMYEKKVEELNLQDRIVFCGKVDKQKLISLYQQADCTVLPSVDRSEAFGLVLIESMACGTPVIASNLPGVRSVVQENETGFLVEPKNAIAIAHAIAKLAENPEMRSSFSKNAIKRVEEKYRWSGIIDDLENHYRKLLNESDGGP